MHTLPLHPHVGRYWPSLLLFVLSLGLLLAWESDAAPVADCRLQGGWDCFQGDIVFISFGEDEDDDRFEFVGTYGTPGSAVSCDVYQTGHYEVSGTQIVATFTPGHNGDVCFISGASPELCRCTDHIDLQLLNSCSQITGPSDEFCIPAAGT